MTARVAAAAALGLAVAAGLLVWLALVAHEVGEALERAQVGVPPDEQDDR